MASVRCRLRGKLAPLEKYNKAKLQNRSDKIMEDAEKLAKKLNVSVDDALNVLAREDSLREQDLMRLLMLQQHQSYNQNVSADDYYDIPASANPQLPAPQRPRLNYVADKNEK